MKKWNLNSWTKYPAKHLPEYRDKKELDLVLNKIKNYPPLVFAGETRSLKKSLADVVKGKAFLLQGGDCAESFAEFNPDNIKDTFKAILQMSLVLTHSASMPVIKVGRIAGQFSKPRSSPVEKKDGKELPRYFSLITEHSKCHPGLPLPHGEFHPGSSLSEGFHKTKSIGFLLRSETSTLLPAFNSSKFLFDNFP